MINEKGKIYYGLGLDNSQLQSDANNARSIIKGVGNSVEAEGARIDNAYRKIATGVAAVFSVQQAIQFAKSVVDVRGEIEALNISFETLVGKDRAKALFSQIRTFAVNTPLLLNDLAKGAQMLLSFDVPAERVMTILKQIGDVSMGDPQKFNSLTLAFSQMFSTGKLMGQDLLQMINAGFNPLTVMAEKTGKTVAQLKKEMEGGSISAEMVAKAFADATGEGGKFNGMLEKQSKGIQGLKSNFQGAWDDMLNDLGEKSQGFISSSIQGATDIVKNYDKVGEALAAIITTYGVYKAAIIATDVIRESAATIRHTAEAEELAKLLTVEQQAKISKMGLSKTSAEYAEAVRMEVAAEMERQTKLAVATNTEIAAARVRLEAARNEKAVIAEKVAAREAELASAVASGNAKKIEAAQTSLNTAQEQLNTASVTVNSAAREVSSKRAVLDTAVRKANTIETGMNTAAQAANVTAINLLSAAKLKLTAIATKLNKVIMSNPYALATAVVVGLGYAIYKLATYQTEAERTATKLNDAIKEGEKAVQAERYQIGYMFDRLRDAKEGTEEYEAAKQAIINQYGNYLKKLGDEKTALNDVAAAYALITEEATKAAKARAMAQIQETASQEKIDKSSDTYDEIAKLLKKKFGAEKGGEYLLKLKPVIMDGAEMTAEMQAIISQFDKFHYAKYDAESGIKVQDEYTSNAISDKLASLAKVTAAADRMIREATEKFGPNTQTEEPTVFDATTASLQQLMAELPKATSKLTDLKSAATPDADAITAQEEQLKTINAQIAAREKELKIIRDVEAQVKLLQDEQKKYGKDDDEYIALEARIKALKLKLPKTEGQESKAETDAARIKRETAERTQKIKDYEAEIKKQVTQSELDIAQARVDAMDEGFAKEQAQNELAYKRLLFANQQREAEMLRALQDSRALEWENEHPKAKAKGETFDRSLVTVADLSPEQRATIAEYYTVAEEIRKKANTDSLERMLAEFMTYEQRRNKITEEYEKQRKALYNEDGTLREGVTQGNVDELTRNRDEAFKAVDNEFAEREDSFQAWMNAIANMTLRQLEAVLAQAEKELSDLEKSGNADSKQVAVARAKVNTARKKVSEASAANDLTPNKRTIKEWEDLYKTLQEAEKEFESIGDAVGGTVGKIISAAGQIMTSSLSMINSIVQLTTTSTTGMETAALASSTAIQTVEKASVILTIIAAAMQIAMAIINMFNKDEEYQEEIENLQRRIDQLQWELDNAEARRMQNNAFDVLEKVKQVYAETRAEVLSLYAAEMKRNSFVYRMLAPVIHQNEILQKSAEKLAVAYANIRYTDDKALGAQKYDEAKKQLENIAQQQLLMQEQIKNEDAKKKTDHGKIEEWERQIQELGEEANKIINEIVEGIIGGSAADIAEELGDAFFEAFQAGEDYAEAWGKKVDDIVADVIKRMLISRFLEEPIGAIFDKYKSKWYKDGNFIGLDELMESMGGFADDLNQVGADFQTIWETLPDTIKDMIPVDDDSAREASERGIATASQESVDENNGRLTAIQGHTYTMNENVKLLVANSGKVLEHLAGIRENTVNLHKLEEMRVDISAMKKSINDITIKGITIKK